jgi:hypothetical protein
VSRAVDAAVSSLIDPDVHIDNPELFCLHRVKDGRDLWFLVNSTDRVQTASVSLCGELHPVRWDTSLGEEQPIAPSRIEGGLTRFQIELPRLDQSSFPREMRRTTGSSRKTSSSIARRTARSAGACGAETPLS